MCVSLHFFTLKTVVKPTKVKMNAGLWILQEIFLEKFGRNPLGFRPILF